jgi:hypothetical protein
LPFFFLERFIFNAYANIAPLADNRVRWDVVPQGTEPQTVETFKVKIEHGIQVYGKGMG